MTDGDYLETLGDVFLSLTGKVLITAEDYHYFRRWQDARMPLSIVQRGMEDAINRWPDAKKYKVAARNCDAAVRETYLHWKRAIGPSSASS